MGPRLAGEATGRRPGASRSAPASARGCARGERPGARARQGRHRSQSRRLPGRRGGGAGGERWRRVASCSGCPTPTPGSPPGVGPSPGSTGTLRRYRCRRARQAAGAHCQTDTEPTQGDGRRRPAIARHGGRDPNRCLAAARLAAARVAAARLAAARVATLTARRAHAAAGARGRRASECAPLGGTRHGLTRTYAAPGPERGSSAAPRLPGRPHASAAAARAGSLG